MMNGAMDIRLFCLLAFMLPLQTVQAKEVWLIEGQAGGDIQPDGNSAIIAAPGGLIVIDTGRHPDHQQKIVGIAERLDRPVAAIINTHWHLDHSGGNSELRRRWPAAAIITSNAVDGALQGFLAESRKGAEDYLASGQASPADAADIALDIAAMDDPANLRPTVPITRSGPQTIAGRRMIVNLARFAATEGDIWIIDPQTRTLFAGDLVVAHVPFFDTACPEGWRRALDAIATTRFDRLVPGHGAPMSRAAFLRWRGAFNKLLDCAASDRAESLCIAGWKADAAEFLPADRSRIEGALRYYFNTRLRAPEPERQRYCKA